MVQLYLLSIVLNGAIAFILISDTDAISKNVYLTIGILAALTGVLKLLLPMTNPPIIGDIIPAIAGVCAGFQVFIEYRLLHLEIIPGPFGGFLLDNRKMVGYVIACVAVLHFFLPQALFI
ncbi:MAG: hypothetical protein LBQ77_07645 [Treponema sp.]|jgi:hypothetical protein|nr:hypothetical protein [Treponema sp.]